MANNWDSDEPTTTTTNNTTTNNNTTKNQKKKRKRKRNKNKNKNKNNNTENKPTSKPKPKPKPTQDTWDTSDEDAEIKQEVEPKEQPQPQILPIQSSSFKPSDSKPSDNNQPNINASDNDDDDNTIMDDKKSKGKYPIWRPEQNYKYIPKNYDYEPNFIQRDEILLKVKRKQTFEEVLRAFEKKHGIENIFSNRELLEIYGINLYNSFIPIYENIGDDNHRPFMIDLDSLLLDIFHSPLISTQLKYGPRILPIIYIINNYLDLLFGGGRSVQIIIFKCNSNLWKYEIHYYLRQYIKYYLLYYWQYKQQNKYNIKYPLVFEFDSFWNNNFSNYIYQYLPVFALIVRPDFSPFIMDENRYLFIYQTFYLMSLHIPCVQSTEITFSSNALYGFTIDCPSNIENYILNKFRLTQSSAKPVKLKPLLEPIKNKFITPIFNNDIITNLNFINTIANDKINENKPNIARLSVIYSLISMFRDNKTIQPFQWDFIRLILLQLIISENENIKNICRAEMLPKIDIATAKKNEKKNNKNEKDDKAKTTSWLDLDSDLEEEESNSEEDEKDEKKEEKKQEKKEYDLDLIIRESWWYKINKLGDNLNKFMIHCTVFLNQQSGNNFDENAFCDCFDSRIFCYLLVMHNRLIGGKDKKKKNKPRKWLQNEKKIMKEIGLTKSNLSELLELYNIIKSEIGCDNKDEKLYPIIQSKYLLNIGFKKEEFNDYNLNIFQSESIRSGYIRVDGDIINILMSNLEEELNEKGLLYQPKKVSYFKQRKDFFRKYDWVSGGIIPDGIKPYSYEHRSYMIFQTFIQKYAQSLEGGKVVLRDVIVSKKKEENNTKKIIIDENKKYKHKRKGKQIQKNKVEDVRAAAAALVQKREREKKLEKVGNLIRICTTMYKDLESRISRLDEELEETNDPIAALPGLTQLHEWATQSAVKCNIERNIYPVVRLWQITFDIFRRFIENNTNEEFLPKIELIHQLQKSLHLMGFSEPAENICRVYCEKNNNKYSFSEVLVPFNRDNIRISIGLSYSRFQMEHCGPYMIRGVGSRPDPRVTGFYPDEWQVKLLDIVDKRYSGLIVAPTSSGKTFVSYYCMKEILQQNKSIKNQTQKGIVIYVSPTKALTWQACADIYSKYGDVFGVLTPDYDHKPLECQVLVCVPESFEKLLMSAQRIQLHKQIKYVIFDEIHCLGRSEGGAIWERLLMLIRSPFLALSATVGHPLKLKKWLNTITNVLQLRSDKYKHKVQIIQHKERWSYLDKHIYLPDTIIKDNTSKYIGCNKDNIGWKSSIRKIHPVGAIGLTINNNILDVYDGFPPLTFSPSDCITLYDSMCKYISEIDNIKYKERLLALKPDTFFKNNLYITKNQSTKYEKLLKKELKSWIVGYNKKSQIDLIDANDDDDDGIDEKLIYEPEDSLIIENKNTKPLSKKEKRKLEQLKRQQERERQRKEADARREAERQKKKRKKKEKVIKTIKKKIEKKEEEIKQETKQQEDEEFEEEEILSVSEKQKRRIIVDKLLNSMASNTLGRIDRMEGIMQHGIGTNDCYSFSWVKTNFINLVIELESTDRLPTLCFVLDRVECEELYLKLLLDLESLEEATKQFEMGQMNDKEMEIERRRREKARIKKLKKLQKLREQKNRQKKDEEENPELHDGLDDGFGDLDADSNKKDYRFSLFNRGDEMDSDDLQFWTRRLLKKTKWPLSHPLMRGLERGIGLHHEGLPLQYRQLVETLFRAKHIKLVVSVASLAMGVNMPARSVVFAGDSHLLDPLNYRQMMGRAGRRGYDNIGHVIFFGISPRKISYLMTSQLTSLNGHYPIVSITSSIRCCKLLYTAMEDEDCDEKYYIGLIKNLFHQPFNYQIPRNDIMNGTQIGIMKKFRYSLDYHIQNGLLSINNLKIDCLGDLASVLHEYEPNNFLFIKILYEGYFHKICKGYTKLKGDHNSKLKKDILCKLLLILCNIFELHPIPISYIPKPSDSKNNYLNKSYLVLPTTDQLDIEILQIIEKYRYNFISHYYNLYYKYNTTNNTNESIENIFGKENIINYLKYYLKYCDGGTFGHNQIFLSDFRGRNMYQNSYIYDFYLHEDYKRIIDEASLRDGLAWKKLKRFQLLLYMINKSLNDVSSLKSKQELINEDVKTKIEEFENSLQKLRQHRYSIYRRQQQFWMDTDGKLWKKYEIEQKKDNLKLQAIGDDFVMAFQDLYKDFAHKFKYIGMTGPIANYDTIININNEKNQTNMNVNANGNNNTNTTTTNNNNANENNNNTTTGKE